MDKTSLKLLKNLNKKDFLMQKEINKISESDLSPYITYLQDEEGFIEPCYEYKGQDPEGIPIQDFVGYKITVKGKGYLHDSNLNFLYKGLLALTGIITAIATMGVFILGN